MPRKKRLRLSHPSDRLHSKVANGNQHQPRGSTELHNSLLVQIVKNVFPGAGRYKRKKKNIKEKTELIGE